MKNRLQINTYQTFELNGVRDEQIDPSSFTEKKGEYTLTIPSLYKTAADSITILESLTSASNKTSLEWGLAIFSHLALLISPLATWTLGYFTKGLELLAEIEEKKAELSHAHDKAHRDALADKINNLERDYNLITLAVPFATAIFAFYIMIRSYSNSKDIFSYKKIFQDNDSFISRLLELENLNDVNKLINMTVTLNLSPEEISLTELLEILHEKKNKYNKYLLFHHAAKENKFGLFAPCAPNDVLRNIFYKFDELTYKDELTYNQVKLTIATP